MFYILLVRFFSRKFFTLSSVIAIDKLEQSLEMMEGTNKKNTNAHLQCVNIYVNNFIIDSNHQTELHVR